jgi:hypothetical protein
VAKESVDEGERVLDALEPVMGSLFARFTSTKSRADRVRPWERNGSVASAASCGQTRSGDVIGA